MSIYNEQSTIQVNYPLHVSVVLNKIIFCTGYQSYKYRYYKYDTAYKKVYYIALILCSSFYIIQSA